MHRIVLIGVLLLAGCQSTKGPLAPRPPGRVDDPVYDIPEQQRRGRDRLALPDDSRTILPKSETGLPGVHGR